LPYSIVAGNPAKLIRMRFPKNTIRMLEESEWWNMDKETLVKNKEIYEGILSKITSILEY
jgi:virginiamycin A acetyltransferase